MFFNRTTSDPQWMNGQPCIRSLRLTDRQELKREYPEAEEVDIQEALAYAAAN